MSAQITVEISPEGTIKLSVNGVKGEACTDLTKKLEEALGTTTSSTPTKEMYEKAVKAVQKVRQ